LFDTVLRAYHDLVTRILDLDLVRRPVLFLWTGREQSRRLCARLDMSSKVNRDLDNPVYMIGLTGAAREVIFVAALAPRLDLYGSDRYNIANLVSYHAFVNYLTS